MRNLELLRYKDMSTTTRINLAGLRRKSQNSNDTDKNVRSDSLPTKMNKTFTQEAACKHLPNSRSNQEENSYQKFNPVIHPVENLSDSGFLQSAVSTLTASGDASSLELDCLKDDFYNVPCEQLARSLLGKILVRKLASGHILKGRIVETECYLGGEDQASHSYRGKLTERNAPMFMKPGTTYVYFTYGMYHCFNISSQGSGAAVLIRAVEPIEGLDVMAELRARGAKNKKKKVHEEEGEQTEKMTSKKKKTTILQPLELCNGPAKLCIAMDIDRDSCNKRDLSTWPGLSVQNAPLTGCVEDVAMDANEDDVRVKMSKVAADFQRSGTVVVTKRVGIESAGREWAAKPLRFYLLGNSSVSKRDRAEEKKLIAQLTATSS